MRKTIQLVIPHDARSVSFTVGGGDTVMTHSMELGEQDSVALVRAPKPKPTRPEWCKAWKTDSEIEQDLRRAAVIIHNAMTWRFTDEGPSYWGRREK